LPNPIKRKPFRNTLQAFVRNSRNIGLLLLAATAFSLTLSNLPVGPQYIAFINASNAFLQGSHLPHTPLQIINKGLMAIFFFLVALEIRRESLYGELSSLQQALLPAGAALGGMVVPALIFVLINHGTLYQSGWGIPMATDIAFSLGVASLLGKRFSVPLRVFLVALAIIDDLGAIVVVAFFYGGVVQWAYLLGAGATWLLLHQLNRLRWRLLGVQVVLGLLLWFLVYRSGISATVAGVCLAFVVPVRQITRCEKICHGPVNYLILPLFALANTAIVLSAPLQNLWESRLGLGIVVGLVLGKPVGIVLAALIMVRLKLAVLPPGITWKQMLGAGLLAGIGFTMSMLVAMLAFEDIATQNTAKISILVASALAATLGFVWMKTTAKAIGPRQH